MATKKKSPVKPGSNNKNDRIYIRLNTRLKDDFEAVALYRGLKSSTLLHAMIVNLIHEEREKRPQIFAENTINSPAANKAQGSAEKISVAARTEARSGKKGKLFIKGEEIVDEAPSAGEEDEEEQ